MMRIRIALPAHLRTLAAVVDSNEVEVDVAIEPTPTLQAALDALEDRYPVLRGTIREHVTKKRRAFIRFFACEQDLSLLDPAVTVLPEAVRSGADALFVVGAIAGGSLRADGETQQLKVQRG